MYQVPRLNDFYLMDVIFREVNNPEHIHIFNHVRIALKLYTASDIVSIGSGATILPNVLKGINLRGSKLGWAKSEPIPKNVVTNMGINFNFGNMSCLKRFTYWEMVFRYSSILDIFYNAR